MNCRIVARDRQRTPLMPSASPPSPLDLRDGQTLHDPELPSYTESDGPSGLVAFATAFAGIDLRGTYRWSRPLRYCRSRKTRLMT